MLGAATVLSSWRTQTYASMEEQKVRFYQNSYCHENYVVFNLICTDQATGKIWLASTSKHVRRLVTLKNGWFRTTAVLLWDLPVQVSALQTATCDSRTDGNVRGVYRSPIHESHTQ
jgi:hypothetical protein